METPTFPMSQGGLLANWGLAQLSTSSTGNWFSCFTVSSNCQGVVSLNPSFLNPSGNPSTENLATLLAGIQDNGMGGSFIAEGLTSITSPWTPLGSVPLASSPTARRPMAAPARTPGSRGMSF